MEKPGITNESKRRVENALTRLRDEYGEFDVVEDAWQFSQDEYEWLIERFEAGTVGGAGAWVCNDEGEVLLVRHQDEETWSDPGGKHEPGETLAETARREVAEETGVECRITGIEFAEVVTIQTDDRPPLFRLIVVFSADHIAGTPEAADGEIGEVGWWARHPSRLRYDALERLDIPADDRAESDLFE